MKISKRKISLILIGIIIIAIYLYAQNNLIEVERIEVEIDNLDESFKGFKIAHISDVHLPKNSSDIENLINKVSKEKPDIIALTGDIIDSSVDIENSELKKLCEGFSNIAPTYAVTGNHEVWSHSIDKWKIILEEENVEVLENEFKIISNGSKNLVLLGLNDNEPYLGKFSNKLEEFQNVPRILLKHRPMGFNKCDVDLVLSGHAHGGQFRIPFINKGVVSPDQGTFPKYTSGLYKSNDNQLVISRGLGNSIIPIRINNRPHLPIIVLR